MIHILIFILITLTSAAATKKTFAEMYQTTMNDNNGRVTYNGQTGIAVLFYLSKEQEKTKPTYGQPFIVPNDEMTKLKINNFYDLIQKMEKELEDAESTKTPATKRNTNTDDTGTTTPDNTGNTGNTGTTNNGTGNGNTGTTTTPDNGTDNGNNATVTPGSNGTTENPTNGTTTNNGTQTENGNENTQTNNGPSRELYCRIMVNYNYTEPIKVLEIFDEKDEVSGTHKAARFPKFISVRTELNKDSRIESIQWDHDECQSCHSKKEECFDNFCTFTDSHYGATTCAEAKKKDASSCGLIIYFGWKGPAHAGFTTQYLKSYRNLPTHYTKYSKDQQFIDAAADIESDWFSF